MKKSRKLRFKRVWHPVGKWEEMRFGMWGPAKDWQKQFAQAIEFTGDHKRYGHFMRRVIREWPISCENALTDYALNRRAWVGHAACALALGIPEHIVRRAWGELTDEQRLLANAEAERAIAEWEDSYAARLGLRSDMEPSLLFKWDSR